MGNININDKFDIGIVSPSYKIFNINMKKININYFNWWIKSDKALYEYMISSEQGASVVRRNLNIDLFYEITMPLLNNTLNEKVSKIIYYLNEKENYENILRNKLQELKKGLMQSMFV